MTDDPRYKNPFKLSNTWSVADLLQKVLDKSYQVTTHGTIQGTNEAGTTRSYERITVSHEGGREMVLDLRFLPTRDYDGSKGVMRQSPIAIRQRGSVGETAEKLFGGKVYREGERYSAAQPVQAIADLIRAGHKHYETVAYSKDPTASLQSIISAAGTGTKSKDVDAILREFNIAPSTALLWGEQRESYYLTASEALGIAWGPGKRYQERKKLAESMPWLRQFTTTPIHYDPYHDVIRGARWSAHRYTAEYGFLEEEEELGRLAEKGLKHIKQEASLLGAREESHPVIRAYNEANQTYGKRTRLVAKSPEEIFGTGEEAAATWGERVSTSKSGVYFRFQNETRLLVSGLITQLPGAAGAAFAARQALPTQTAGGEAIETAYGGSGVVRLPWKTKGEFDTATRMLREQMSRRYMKKDEEISALMLKPTSGQIAAANSAKGVILGYSAVYDEEAKKVIRKPIYSRSRPYETEIDSVTVVMPKFYNLSTGEFSGFIPANITAEEREQWQETATLDKRFRALFGKTPKIEYSGKSEMYISYTYAGLVDPSLKLGGSKEGLIQTAQEAFPVNIPGVGTARPLMVSQETKSSADRWIGSFTAMPYENKIRLLEMTDPRLAKHVDQLVKSGRWRRDDVTLDAVAAVYKPMIKGTGDDLSVDQFMSPREIISKPIMKILEEKDPTRKAEYYKRFGYYSFLNSNQDVSTMIYSQQAVDYEKKLIKQETGKSSEELGIHYDPIAGKKGMYRVRSSLPQNSYLMPLVYETAVEWPMGGGEMPLKAVEQFNTQFPEIASALGMKLSAGVLGSGDPSRSTRAWVDFLKSNKLQESARRGNVYRTDKMMTIDQAMASKILSELRMKQGDIAKGVSRDDVKALGEVLKSRAGRNPDMIFFKGTQAYMPTTQVAMNLEAWNKATDQASTGFSTRYLSAIFDLLRSEAYGRATPGNAYRRWVNYQNEMIDKSSDANKILGKIETGAVVSRNYNVNDFLAPNEAAISDTQLEAIARKQPGVRNGTDVKEFVDYVKKLGYLPAFFHRLPSVGGVHAVKILTNDAFMKKYGSEYDLNKDVGSARGTIWINRWMHESGIGDRDIDKSLIWSGLLTKRLGGKLNIQDVITSTAEWQERMSKTGEEIVNEWKASLGGDDNIELFRKYSHLSSYWQDYMDAKEKGFNWKKTADFGWVRSGIVNDMATIWGEIRVRRATSYNALEFMQQAVDVIGIGSDELTKAIGVYGIQNVQSSLEALESAGIKDPAEALLVHAGLGNDNQGGVISMGMPDPKVVGKVNFENVYRPDQVMPFRHVMLSKLLMAYANNPNISDEMIKIIFGGNKKMMDKIGKQLNKAKKPEDRFDVMMENRKLMEGIWGTTSVASLLTNFALHRAAKARDEIPFDLRKDLMEGAESVQERSLAILRSISTGKGIRDWTFGELKDALGTVKQGSIAYDRILGLMRTFGTEKFEEMKLEMEWGGLSKSLMRDAFRQGMTSMRASDFGYVAEGLTSGAISNLRKHKILYQKTMGMTAEWIAQMYRLDKADNMNDIFNLQDDIKRLESGNEWEDFVSKRLSKYLGMHIGGGRGNFEGTVGGVEFRFIPDFLKIEKGKLVVTEVKKGTDETMRAGIWQAAINKYGLMDMALVKETKLRNILADYVKVHNELANKPKGKGTIEPLSKDWVDQAVTLIKSGAVEARVLARNNKPGSEKLLRVDIEKSDLENTVQSVQDYLRNRAPFTTEEFEKLEEERAIKLEDRYKSLVRVKNKFAIPMGIKESFMRLWSEVKFARTTGGFTKKQWERFEADIKAKRKISKERMAQAGTYWSEHREEIAASKEWIDKFDQVFGYGIGITNEDGENIKRDGQDASVAAVRRTAYVPKMELGETATDVLDVVNKRGIAGQPVDSPAQVFEKMEKYEGQSYQFAIPEKEREELEAGVKHFFPDEPKTEVVKDEQAEIQAEVKKAEKEFKAKKAKKEHEVVNKDKETTSGDLGNGDLLEKLRQLLTKGERKPYGFQERFEDKVMRTESSMKKWLSSTHRTAKELKAPIDRAREAAKDVFIKTEFEEAGLSKKELKRIDDLRSQAIGSKGVEGKPIQAIMQAVGLGGKTSEAMKQALTGTEAGKELIGAMEEAQGVAGFSKAKWGATWLRKGGLLEGLNSRLIGPAARKMIKGVRDSAVDIAQGTEDVSNLSGILREAGIMGSGGKKGGGLPQTELEREVRIKGLEIFGKSLDELDKKLGKTGESAGKSAKLFTDLNTAMSSRSTEVAMSRLMGIMKGAGVSTTVTTAEGKEERASPLQLMKRATEAAQGMISKGGVQAEVGTEMGRAAMRASEVLTTAFNKQGDQGGDLAHLARRALGGFGMMYLRTMGGLTFSGFSAGEKQAVAMRQQFEESAAKVAGGYGAAGPYISPAQRIQVMQGLYGTPSNPLQSLFAPIIQSPVGREVMGGAAMGVGTFAVMQQLEQWGGENKVTSFLGKHAAPIAGVAMALGMIGDISNQQQNLPSLAYTNAMQAGNQTLSLTSFLAERFMPADKQEEYVKQLEAAKGILGWAGQGMSQEDYEKLKKSPMRDTVTAMNRIKSYEQFQVAKGMGAYDALLASGITGDKADVLSRGVPLLAESFTTAHPELQPIAGELTAFGAENNLDFEQLEKIGSQWQFGIANKQTALQLAQISGLNLSTMKGGIGERAAAMAQSQIAGDLRDIMMQGAEATQGLGAFTYNLMERGGVYSAANATEQWAREQAVYNQMAPLYGTAGYGALQAASGAYMQTLGSGVGQMPAPNIQQYVGMTTTQAATAQQAAQANLNTYEAWQSIAMTGAQVAAPVYLDPTTATFKQAQSANFKAQLLKETQGAQAWSISKNLAMQGITGEPLENLMKKIPTEGLPGKMEAQYGAMRQQWSEAREAMGLPSTAWETSEKAPLSMFHGGTIGGMAAQTAQATQATQWFQQAEAYGRPTAIYQQFGEWASTAPPGVFSMISQAMNANPMAIAAMQTAAPDMMAGVLGKQYAGYGGPISGDLFAMTGTEFAGAYGTGASVNGMAWGTTSLAMGKSNAATIAQQIWGGGVTRQGDIGTWAPTTTGTGYSAGAINAAINGFTLPNGEKVGGIWGLQAYGNQQSFDNQMASIGVQFQQLALTNAFTTGVGLNQYAGTINPQTGQPFGINTGKFSFNVGGVGGFTSTGGGFWGLQDAQRALGNMQQSWQFQSQATQQAMQTRQFYQNMGMQQQQAYMQRGWTQQDWAYQNQTRGLQWGWQQEDFAENVRFMSGRQRRLATRQQERATIMHDLEGEQIDKQRDRQKEMWRLEDERFAIQKQQYEENRKFQEDQLNKAKEFFEVRKQLEEESVKLQRAYWVEQQELQRASAGIAAKAAIDQKEFNETMIAYNEHVAKSQGLLNTLTEEGMQQLHDQILYNTVPAVDRLTTALEKLVIAGGGKNRIFSYENDDDGDYEYKAAGTHGWVYSATKFVAGEGALPERVDVTPLGQDIYKSRWSNTALMDASIPAQESGEPRTINIYIGNRKLADFIIDTVKEDLEIH